MEHQDVKALLELAAVEPGGFERLQAGDTAEAASVAGHLAGCPSCATEYEELGRSAVVIRYAVRSLPPADLRERTLARVLAEGRIRGAAAAPSSVVRPDAGALPVQVPVPAPAPVPHRRLVPIPWVVALAAALVVAVVGVTGWWWTAGRLGDAEATIASLTRVADDAARIAAVSDSRTVGLDGTDAAGWLLFSASAGEMAVETAGLPEPGPGQEYRCWVEVDGERTVLGRMWVDGDVAWWAGPASALADVSAGATFGVSIVDVDGDRPGQPVLLGEL